MFVQRGVVHHPCAVRALVYVRSPDAGVRGGLRPGAGGGERVVGGMEVPGLEVGGGGELYVDVGVLRGEGVVGLGDVVEGETGVGEVGVDYGAGAVEVDVGIGGEGEGCAC